MLAAFGVYAARDSVLSPLRLGADNGTNATLGEVLNDPAPADMAGGAGSGPESAADRGSVVHGEISRGTPFFVEMQRAGVSPLEIQNLVSATKDNFNFKKVKPGQEYSVFADSDGDLDSLRFVVDDERILNIHKVGDSYESRIDTIPYRLEHLVTSGTIEGSIYLTLQSIDADPELASYLAVIFQWDIDFFKDIRLNDTFSILYEKKVFPDGSWQLGHVLAARICCQGEEHFAFRYVSADGDANYFDENGKSLQKSLLRAPLRYSRVSSNFSYRRLHPVKKHYAPHLGVDYAAPHGTPVRATGSGTVIVATRHSANGNYVKIRHNNRYTTYYLHLSRFGKGVRKGARVKQGQIIGYVGSTGISTGPHLDYRIKIGNRFVNPRTVKLPSKKPVPKDERRLYDIVRDSYLVDLFDPSLVDETIVVEKPIPVKQRFMAVVF
jgi:murein DD-endopeptidase MepM/ murein hydrolase activator NlpD